MSDSDQLPDSFLRLARSWLVLPFVGYLFAIPALGPGALFVPIVIYNAPLGVISYFDEVSMKVGQHQTAIRVIHLVFWSLFATGFLGRFLFPLWALRAIWCSLVLLLVMSVSGCAREFGAGLRNEGNWH